RRSTTSELAGLSPASPSSHGWSKPTRSRTASNSFPASSARSAASAASVTSGLIRSNIADRAHRRAKREPRAPTGSAVFRNPLAGEVVLLVDVVTDPAGDGALDGAADHGDFDRYGRGHRQPRTVLGGGEQR